MNPETLINILFALRDRLGNRATVAQAIGVFELLQAGNNGLTPGELKALAGTGSPSSKFANTLVKSGLARKVHRRFRKVPVLVAEPRIIKLLNPPTPL